MLTTEVRTKQRCWNRKAGAGLFAFPNASTKVAPAPLESPTSSKPSENMTIPTMANHHMATTTTVPKMIPLAIDCEMVGVGLHANVSVLARVSIVDVSGQIVYDQFVKVEEKVTDYRTKVSGIRAVDLESGISYGKCRAQVRKILANRVLVGHGLQNDLEVLNLRHPSHMVRDSSLYFPYMKDFGAGVVRSRSLRDLSREFCGRTIQGGEHDSIEDARAAMALYVLRRGEWDDCALHYHRQQPTFYNNNNNKPYHHHSRRQHQQQRYHANSSQSTGNYPAAYEQREYAS